MEAFSQILVYGAGAIGSYLGARCSPRATLIARPDHVEAIRRHGLAISGLEEDRVTIAAQEQCPAIRENALLMVAVKRGDVEAAGHALAPQVRTDTVVAALSNGLDPDRVLADILDRPVPRVIVQLGVTLDGPGRISCWGGHLVLGHGAVEDRIASSFGQGGLVVQRTQDLPLVVWKKFAVNCVANPLSALTGRCNRELVHPELAPLRDAIVAEVARLAETENVNLPADLRERIDLALGSSGNRTSMLQDIRRGRPTEIEHLNGLVARRLADHGIAAPINQGLAQMVRMISHRERERRRQS